MIVKSTPAHIKANDCSMDILIQNNDSNIVSTVWFSKEFPLIYTLWKSGAIIYLINCNCFLKANNMHWIF